MTDALESIDSQSRDLVFVDFDYTLFSSNSTEEFLAACKPSVVVALIDFAVRRCIPWKLMGAKNHYRLRDYVCVILVALLTPWNILTWKRNAPALFDRLMTIDIAQRLRSIEPSRLIIISFGMRFIIRALLARDALADVPVIATPVLIKPDHFHHGKLDMAVKMVGELRTRTSTLITDSWDDKDLLDYCRNGILIPQQGVTFNAGQRLYIPLRYFATVKYSRSFMVDQLLLVDLAIYILSLTTGFASLFAYALACPLFILSLNCIYEMGYYENDMHAAGFEVKPVLSDSVSRYRDYPIGINGWLWATTFAALGLTIASSLKAIDPTMMVPAAIGWAAALLVLRITFYIYNRVSTHQRTLIYPLLQMLKYGSIFVVFPATPLGVILTISQIATLWTNYLIYRHGGLNATFGRDLFRTTFFVIGAGLFALSYIKNVGDPFNGDWTTGNLFCFSAAMVWSIFRALKVQTMQRLKGK